jgi:hypothetical protein
MKTCVLLLGLSTSENTPFESPNKNDDRSGLQPYWSSTSVHLSFASRSRPVTGQFSACQEDVSECVPIPDACSLGLLRSFQIYPGLVNIEKANWKMGDFVRGFTHEKWWIFP